MKTTDITPGFNKTLLEITAHTMHHTSSLIRQRIQKVTLFPIRTNLYIVCSLLFFSSQSDVMNSYREVISCVVNTCAQIDLAQCWPNTAAELYLIGAMSARSVV